MFNTQYCLFQSAAHNIWLAGRLVLPSSPAPAPGPPALQVFCVWVGRSCRREDGAPPSYVAVTKPPAYSSAPGWRRPDGRRPPPDPPGRGACGRCCLLLLPLLSLVPGSRRPSEETEPPAYSELYSREDSQLDRIVVRAQRLPKHGHQYIHCIRG
jgi:hypothetical protein